MMTVVVVADATRRPAPTSVAKIALQNFVNIPNRNVRTKIGTTGYELQNPPRKSNEVSYGANNTSFDVVRK